MSKLFIGGLISHTVMYNNEPHIGKKFSDPILVASYNINSSRPDNATGTCALQNEEAENGDTSEDEELDDAMEKLTITNLPFSNTARKLMKKGEEAGSSMMVKEFVMKAGEERIVV
ncbi:hypothetical protein EG329_002955 [Mollisiaceae sp. DMI_Dod_QoI]|nr:hypothetical protein EG329_002955 [Helotiales sp. DMI_Dod_QoI]